MQFESFKTIVKGHVRAVDKKTGEVLLDKDNAIHPQNMAIAIARGLANENNSQIYRIALGNGGTTLKADGTLEYNPPRTVGTYAKLYNETYNEVVDDLDVAVPEGNFVISQYDLNSQILVSLVVCQVTLTPNEPAQGWDPNDSTRAAIDAGMGGTPDDYIEPGQDSSDGGPTDLGTPGYRIDNPEVVDQTKLGDPYIFDELGLKTADGLLLSHLIFSGFEKTANREIVITYTLTISVS